MSKFLLIGFMVLAVSSAANLYELNNLIEYEDVPIRRGILPYPYQDSGVKFVEPVHVARYEPVIVNGPKVPVTDVVLSKPGFISSIASSLISLAASTISFIFHNAKALIFGSIAAIGFCKCTPVCSQLATISSISEVSQEISSFATPERITRAAEFVKDAIKKYRAYQKK